MLLLAAIWAASLLGFTSVELRHTLALVPRDLWHLHGILTMPFVHGDWAHLLANSVPLAILLALVRMQAGRRFWPAIVLTALGGGLALWLIGRYGSHVGASGLLFGLLGLLLGWTWFQRTLRALSIAGLVMLVYGSLLWGVLPAGGQVSWEGHLCGLVAGFLVSRWVPTPAPS